MAQNTKIIPTIAEREAALNTNFFDIKRTLTASMIHSLEQMGEQLLREVVQPALSGTGYDAAGFKVTRGENFNGYPYIVLDCPRINDTQSEVICRTVFWWGHHWSLQFAVQGNALKKLNFSKLHNLDAQWKIDRGHRLWEHNPTEEQSIQVSTFLTANEILAEGDMHFFKLYKKILLAETEYWPPFTPEDYIPLFDLLT